MPEESDYLGREEVPPDFHLDKPRYRIRCRCLRCGKTYSKIVSKLTDDNPPCPRKVCKELAKAEERALMEANLRAMIEAERGPGHIGNKPIVQAIDKTAEIVQQDYALTNLKDSLREGDIAAPRLPPKQQDAADNFFNPKAQMKGIDARHRKQMELLGRRAISGAFRSMAVNPAELLPMKKGEKALRSVRTEKLK